ncbi:MAG: twin arginine-targeting protein translocase TatC [Bacteroidetes bacterium 4572_117]|nr:MAG: twin arginine-targeting protein translocase TatC [Bacteroidetes bacterium 4572_117]
MNEEEQNSSEMGFLDHLEVLRWNLIRSFLAILIFAIAAFIFREFIFDTIILAPKTPEFFTNRMLCEFGTYINVKTLCINSSPFQIININMAGQFSTHIMVSLVAGFLIAFPYVFWEVWSFIRPALYSNEKQHARGAVLFSSLLFFIGVLFGYYLIVPLSVHFLGGYNVSNQVLNQINLGSYISTITSIVLAAGIVFELPIIIYFLSKAGLITPVTLRTYRKHSLVVILALSAIITPPDVFSQILVALPLVILYEIGIKISKRVYAKDESLLI